VVENNGVTEMLKSAFKKFCGPDGLAAAVL
jgi:hypothetical protein